jgi:hypothetical protein
MTSVAFDAITAIDGGGTDEIQSIVACRHEFTSEYVNCALPLIAPDELIVVIVKFDGQSVHRTYGQLLVSVAGHGLTVGVAVAVEVGVTFDARVVAAIGDGVAVAVGDGVAPGDGVAVAVSDGVAVGDGVAVSDSVAVGDEVAVAVDDGVAVAVITVVVGDMQFPLVVAEFGQTLEVVPVIFGAHAI